MFEVQVGQYPRHAVAAHVEIESTSSKQFTTVWLQALKAGAFNRVLVARGKITGYHTRALSQRPKAKDVRFRACNHRCQPAPPYHGGGGGGVVTGGHSRQPGTDG